MKAVRTLARLRPRAANAHKGDFGTVLVVAGSEQMLGAAVLCASGAQRGGAGLVRVALPAALQPLLPLAVPGATTLSRSTAELLKAVANATAVVVGPGLGATAATRSLVRAVLRASRVPVVLDADALNVLAPLAAPLASRAPLVLTPHPGEAGRLLGSDSGSVQADRPRALRALCERSGAVVVLKGAGTLVGDAGRCYTNRSGNPGMATGGSGDVLAGLLGALLAQDLAPFDAACLAVNVHGRAGDAVAKELGQRGLLASDLPLAIAKVLG
ncbi:MAG TPA: NAD(P)H-hydrate dehydratase [Planctomycetota bacterium]